ncbi:MAG: AsmA-like C-terminal region-containing protein [Chitinophagaceae bacterium]
MEHVKPLQTLWQRYWRILLRIVSAAVLIMLLLWAAIYIYVRFNKAELLIKVSKAANERLRGQLIIKDLGVNFLVNFPYVTLRLDSVSLRDSMYSTHKHELLQANKLFVSAPTMQLLTGKIHPSKIVMEQGQIFLFTDGNTYTNRYLSSAKDTSKSFTGSLPDRIVLKNMRLVMYDIPKKKLHEIYVRKMNCGIDESSGGFNLKTKLDATIYNLMFNLDKGSYAKDKTIKGDFRLRFDTATRVLTAKNAELNIAGQPFVINAGFHFDSVKNFTLQFASNRIAFRQIIGLVPAAMAKKLDSVDFTKPIKITADLAGRTVFRDTPVVNINIWVNDNEVKTPSGNFQNCSFHAIFNNHITGTSKTDENSAIRITGLKADWEGIPLSSDTIDILNLKYPVVTCDIQSNTDLSKLDDVIGTESFRFIKGDARAKIYYHGPVGDSAKVSPYISGSFSFSNAEIEYLPRNIKLSEFNGDIIFDSSDIRFKSLKGKVQQMPITINAEIKNFFSLMDIDPGKLQLTSTIYMPALDVQQFKSFLGQRTKAAARKAKARLTRLSNSIDRFMDLCNMNTSLQADRVSYKNFLATDVKANVLLANNAWQFNQVALRHADGSLNLDGALENVQGNNSNLNMRAKLQGINISKLFRAFNNFGLDDISSENIRGLLTTDIRLTGIINNNSAAIVPSSLQGTIDLSLMKGELINFEPLQKMSFFLLKKRDFSNLEFAELKNTFELKGQSIIINRMEIQSTALSMYVEGLYDMKGDSTDLVIQVPLNNLKKRKPDYVPENKGVNAKTGMSVYVRAKSGKGDEIDFKIGLFKKKSVLEKIKESENPGK